ncbi:MAG: DUF3106 domain-containing protein [Pseudomonadota bacterium]
MTLPADLLPPQFQGPSGLRKPLLVNRANKQLQAWAFATTVVMVLPQSVLAQGLAAPGAPSVAGKTSAPAANKALAAPATAGPAWSELTHAQQQSLKPLAHGWASISEPQKRKWLEISKNYASLPPEGQATMHSRMNEWVAMSPQERAQARLNFAKTKELSKQLTPEEKKAKWQTYQALSPEEKAKLAEKASPKPVGAATAVKPVAPQKLATVPPHANPNPKAETRPAPKIASPQTVTPAAKPAP